MTIGLQAFHKNNGYNGPGTATTAEIQELAKALEAGYQVGAGKTGGSALRVESLEASLKVLTFTSSHIKLWKKIPKLMSKAESSRPKQSWLVMVIRFLIFGKRPTIL